MVSQRLHPGALGSQTCWARPWSTMHTRTKTLPLTQQSIGSQCRVYNRCGLLTVSRTGEETCCGTQYQLEFPEG